METLPKSKLKGLQLERLQAIVERAYAQNRFYRNLYDEAGVKPSDIKSLEDMRKLPFLEKKTVRAAYPYGMAFVKPGGPGGALEIHATSGTTGKSVPVFATKRDIDYWADLNARELWMTGMRPVDILMNCYGYGLADFLGPGMTCEWETGDGMHAWADAFLVECIDPETGEWVEEGKDGELVWTWLTGDGTAMIRYRSRDLSRTWWENRCACGRTHPKISAIKGRSDDAVSIRGLIVFPSQVEAALVKFPETGANFRIIVDKHNGLDTFDLKVEVKDAAVLSDAARNAALSREMAESVKTVTGNSPKFELVAPDSLPRASGGEAKTASARVEARRKK